MDKNFIEGLKGAIRTAIMGIVSYLLTEGVLQALIMALLGTRLDPVVVGITTVSLTSVLKGLDEWFHKADITVPVITPTLEMKGGFIDGLKK